LENICSDDALGKLHHDQLVFADGGWLALFSARASFMGCGDGLRRIAAFAITTKGKMTKSNFIVRLKGFSWTREFLPWLAHHRATRGSGKTRSGINQSLFQVFKTTESGRIMVLTIKVLYWETLVEMAAKSDRRDDLILLQVRPDNPPASWKPAHTFNLLSDPTIPPSTYAKFVVDTVTSLGQRAEQSFFKSQAQTHIGLALESLTRLGHGSDLVQRP
jgi:hypothetical protein